MKREKWKQDFWYKESKEILVKMCNRFGVFFIGKNRSLQNGLYKISEVKMMKYFVYLKLNCMNFCQKF